MKKSLIPILLSFIILSGSIGIAEAAALTQSQINAIIGLLRSFGADEKIVADVSATLGGTGTGNDTTAWCHTFSTNLKIGNDGDEVNALQIALQREGFSISNDETAKSGGTPMVAYFVPANLGESTASAVTGFQEKYRDEILTPLGLKYGTGYVGKSTRAKLNQLYGCGGATLPPVSAGYLEIEPSSASIAVGESVSMQAMYQPPMPKCPEGFSCPQVMPARFPVEAEWTSSNPSVAAVSYKEGPALQSIPIVRTYDRKIGVISGISAGTADIKALYKSPSGTVLTATVKTIVGSGSSAPSITVLSPNGGEVLVKGKNYVVRWTSKGGPGPFDIFLVKDGKILGDIGFVGGADSSSFSWTVGADPISNFYSDGTGYKIRLSNQNGNIYDESDAPFSISVSPNVSADSSSSGDSTFAALLFSLERQLEELERILNSLLSE